MIQAKNDCLLKAQSLNPVSCQLSSRRSGKDTIVFAPKLHFKQSAFCLLHEAGTLKRKKKECKCYFPICLFHVSSKNIVLLS